MAERVAVVPAGGRGTRLAAVTAGRPKSLAPVLGEPFLHLQLRHMRSLGVDRVHLCLGHGAAEILAAVAGGVPGGPEVTHTVESEPLGVIGAVRAALPALPSRFLMTYGDVLPPPAADDLWEQHASGPYEATMLVAPAADESNVELGGDQRTVSFYGKGGPARSHVDIGLCVLDASCVAAVPADRPVGEPELFTALVARRALGALPWPIGSLHIGDPEHLREVEAWAASAGGPSGGSQRVVGSGEPTARSHAARTWRA